MLSHPCLYTGDYNCRHAEWGYIVNRPDGECLAGWARINSLALLYNDKDASRFYSGRWNTGTNPDLAFASLGPYSRYRIDVFLKRFPGHNINLRLSRHQACLLSDGISKRPNGVTRFL